MTDIELEGFEKKDVPEETFLAVFGKALDAIEAIRIPYCAIGGIPLTVLGRRWTHEGEDVDLLVKPDDADRALEALEDAGFDSWKKDPTWLYKGAMDGVVIDLITRSEGDIVLDDEMNRRSTVADFRGREIRVIPWEDLLVMKVVAHKEDTAHYWFQAITLLSGSPIDWDYLVARAKQYGPRRVLSLLVYAQAEDLAVPTSAIRALHEEVFDR